MCLILSLGIVGPLMNFTTYVNETKAIEYAVHDVDELLHVKELPDTGKPVDMHSKDIQLQNVSFSYDKESGKQVLSHIDLKIPEGKFTALVGPSGGGKSTIARLIARFWDVNDGEITIGGVDIRSMPLAQLADIVSFVTQDNFLFNCSIKENIRLGNPDATDEEVYAAAKAACCDEFIHKLEQGYDTMAGDAGNRLSGGEKQRISIARMILKNAPNGAGNGCKAEVAAGCHACQRINTAERVNDFDCCLANGGPIPGNAGGETGLQGDGKLIEPNRHHGKQAYRHKALDCIEGDLFDIPSAGGILDAAFKAGYYQTGTIERPGQIGEKQHNALHPAHLEQLDAHVTHLGKEVPEESHDLPVDPVNDLTEDGIGNKIPNKQWFAHLFSG